MFSRAMEDNFVTRNPAKDVRTSSVKPKDSITVLSKEEQALFFKCSMGTFYDNFFTVAVNTGMRPGELFALTEKNIDFEKKLILVTNTLVYQKYDDDDKKTFHLEDPKTRTSFRSIPMNTICEKALKKQIVQKAIIKKRNIKLTDFPELLFTTKYNTPLNSVIYCAAIKRIVDETNLTLDDLEQIEPFSGHTFRHIFATRCIEANVKPKILQQFLGHASLNMTMDLYVHATDESQKEGMELFEQELSKVVLDDKIIEEKYRKSKLENEKVVSLFA